VAHSGIASAPISVQVILGVNGDLALGIWLSSPNQTADSDIRSSPGRNQNTGGLSDIITSNAELQVVLQRRFADSARDAGKPKPVKCVGPARMGGRPDERICILGLRPNVCETGRTGERSVPPCGASWGGA
jgi:hypothetical protein